MIIVISDDDDDDDDNNTEAASRGLVRRVRERAREAEELDLPHVVACAEMQVDVEVNIRKVFCLF